MSWVDSTAGSIKDSDTPHHLTDQGRVVQVFEPILTPLQHQVLDLLAIPADTYTGATPDDPTT